MGLGKKLLAKAKLYTRRKKDVSKEIIVKDFGDFEVKIIYSTDYLNNRIQLPVYIVFLIVIDISKKDLLEDFTNKFIPFMKITEGVRYIVKYKNNKIYSYVGISCNGFKEISKYLYPDGSDISFILSRLMRTFNDEMNNEFLDDLIPNKFLNTIDTVYKEHLTPIRSTIVTEEFNKSNINHIDNIPNIDNIFSNFDLLYIANIYTSNSSRISMRGIISFLKYLLYTRCDYPQVMNEINQYIYQIKNDSYFNIVDNTNLIDYAQHCKIIYNNINCDTFDSYDDVDEVLEETEEII